MIFEFAERLVRLRTEKGWSQNDLARRSGISDSSIGKYENNIALPNLQNASALADSLGVSLDYLCEGDKAIYIPIRNLTQEQMEILLELCKEFHLPNAGDGLLSNARQQLLARIIQQFVQQKTTEK